MKKVFITGANKGIGLELTKLFLEHSAYEVFALSRSTDNLKLLRNEANEQKLNIIEFDLGNDLSEKDTLVPVDTNVDILINNAGHLVNKPFEETSLEEWETSISINLYGPVRIIKSLLPNLKKAQNSHIVNISSMGAYMGSDKFSGLSAYSSSKSALTTLTECLAVELGKYGVKCNCLCLGAVNTEMLNKAFPGYKAPVNAAEMAEFVHYFSTKGHTFFNGKVLPVALNNPE